jgi:CO/xanthine dehydrogenase FAD-binding subunit
MKFPKEMTRTLKEFGYWDPREIEEAVPILEKLDKRAVILAGGTDLLNHAGISSQHKKYKRDRIHQPT